MSKSAYVSPKLPPNLNYKEERRVKIILIVHLKIIICTKEFITLAEYIFKHMLISIHPISSINSRKSTNEN